ncbi:MAG: hypothetical protein ACP5MG_05515 [Verrucomicrobiia bacterium]|jgi:hypothetical protein
MDEYEIIATLDDEVQAERLDGVLSQRNIPYLIISYHDSAFDGLFSGYKGWGCVKAPASHREEILTILNDIKSERE